MDQSQHIIIALSFNTAKPESRPMTALKLGWPPVCICCDTLCLAES